MDMTTHGDDSRSSAACEHQSRRAIMSRYFNLSAPVGHSGVPVPKVQENIGRKGAWDIAGDAQQLVFKSKDEGILSDRILNLPIEIKTTITNNLSQYDLVNLASVSKSFYDAAMFSLYENIVVDSSYSILSSNMRTEKKQRCTYIKTKYNLKKFMNSLCEEELETAFPLGILVKSLKIVSLPDGVSNTDVVNFVHQSIHSLTRLSCLYWESGSRRLPLDTLQYLPNKSELTSLAINLDLSKCYGVKDQCNGPMAFPQLERLSVAPFNDSESLQNFMKWISIGEVAHRLKVLQLKRKLPAMKMLTKKNLNLGQSLVLTKFMVDNNLAAPDAIETDKSVDEKIIDYHFWDFLQSQDNPKAYFKQLTTLDLDSMNMLATDSQKMIQFLNLSSLETLSLNNVNEIQWLPEIDFQLTDFTSAATQHYQDSILVTIAPLLKNLKRVKLDYHEATRDSVPHFLNILAQNSIFLQEIDITVTWDNTKLATIVSWDQLMDQYCRSVCKHAETLTKLSVVTQESLRYCAVPKKMPIDSVVTLTKCHKLKSLRINGDSLQPTGIHLLPRFPQLRFLSLYGKRSGGPPHMGLQMVHDGVMDNWYRVMHVAITLAQANTRLQFVQVDKCLFECGKSGNAIPRPDVLNNWFMKQTRVLVTEDDF